MSRVRPEFVLVSSLKKQYDQTSSKSRSWKFLNSFECIYKLFSENAVEKILDNTNNIWKIMPRNMAVWHDMNFNQIKNHAQYVNTY